MNLATQISNERSKAGQLAAELQNERSTKDKLNQELQDTKDQLAKSQSPVSPGIASILLFSGATRSVDTRNTRNTLVAPASAATIELKLSLDNDDHQKYKVSIRSPDGSEVFSQDPLKARGPRLAGAAEIEQRHAHSKQVFSFSLAIIELGRNRQGKFVTRQGPTELSHLVAGMAQVA